MSIYNSLQLMSSSSVIQCGSPGGQAAAVDGISVQELKIQKKLSSGALVANQSLLVLPSRVPCEVRQIKVSFL